MRVLTHRGRTYEAASKVESAGLYRGVFDVDSLSDKVHDGVINEATPNTYSTREEAEIAAQTAARAWIDHQLDKN